MPNKTTKQLEERYRATLKRRPSSRDEEEAGPSKRRPHPAQGPAPKSGPTSQNDPYYDYHSNSDPILSPADLKADREQFLRATQEQRGIVVYLVCKISLICEKNPEMVQQILCTLGPYFPGMVKDPRSVFHKAPQWEIKPTNIVNGHGKVVGSFWHRGLEVGIRAQSPLTIKDIEYYLHVDMVPLRQPARPSFQAWTVLAQLLDATKEPGEPFVVSMLCGNSKPSASVLLGPVCKEAKQLLNANIKPRAVLADAEARALVKETVRQHAFYGCTKCTIKGKRIGRGVSFHDNTAAVPRTHASFVGHRYKIHRKPSQRANPLELLGINLIRRVSIADDRHLLHLGAARNFYNTFTIGLRNAPKMPKNALRLLHHRLSKIRFPVEREDKKFRRQISMWPPSMWAYFMDVVGCVVLKHVLREIDYHLFCWLHFAVAICNHKRYTNLLGYAEKLFKNFVERYYQRVRFVPCSIHYLLHVVDEIRDFRSLPNISTNKSESALSIMSANVTTAHGPRALKQGGTALMLRECVRLSQASKSGNQITHNGGRVLIRPKFELISDSISLTDANSWFLTTTGTIVKFKSASVGNLGLVVLGQPLHEQSTTFVHEQSDVPLELNIFATRFKTILSETQQYHADDLIAKLCVVDMKLYTSFVPLLESLPEC